MFRERHFDFSEIIDDMIEEEMQGTHINEVSRAPLLSSNIINNKTNKKGFNNEIDILASVQKKSIGPFKVAILNEENIDNVLTAFDNLLFKNCTDMTSSDRDVIVPFIFCENLEIVAKSQIILADSKKPVPVFSYDPVNSIEKPDVSETYYQYITRMTQKDNFTLFNQYRLTFNYNDIPSIFINAQRLLQLSSFETDFLLSLLKDPSSNLLAFHFIKVRPKNLLLIDVLERHILDTLIPNPQNLLVSFDASTIDNDFANNEFIHYCLSHIHHYFPKRFKVAEKLVPLIKTFDELIIIDIFKILFSQSYYEKIALLARDCILEKKVKKNKTKLVIMLLKYQCLSSEINQNIQIFCVNYLKEVLSDENECHSLLKATVLLKKFGTNEMFRGSFDDLIVSMKSTVEKSESNEVLITNYVVLDLLIQSLNYYQDERVLPLYNLIGKKIIENFDKNTEKLFGLIRNFSLLFVFPMSGFIPICVEYLQQHQKEYDNIPVERLIMTKVKDMERYELVNKFMIKCFKNLNINCCNFTKVKEMFQLSLTPLSCVQFIKIYNTQFKRELIEIAIESANRDIQFIEENDIISLKRFYKIFFELHLVFAKAPKSEQTRVIPALKVCKVLFKYIRILYNDIKDLPEKEQSQILSSFIQFNTKNNGKDIICSKTIYSNKIKAFHSVIIALIKDTISGFDEYGLISVIKKKCTEPSDWILFYLFNCVDREQYAMSSWLKKVLENDYIIKSHLLDKCKEINALKTVGFKMGIDLAFNTNFHLLCVEKYQLKILGSEVIDMKGIHHAVIFLNSIECIDITRNDIELFGEKLNGKYPLNIVEKLYQSIQEEDLIQKIQTSDECEDIGMIYQYHSNEVNGLNLIQQYGIEKGIQVLDYAINHLMIITNGINTLKLIGMEESITVFILSSIIESKTLESLTETDKKELSEIMNGKERELFGYLSCKLLQPYLNLKELKHKKLFDIQLGKWKKMFDEICVFNEQDITEIVDVIYTMFKQSKQTEYLYLILGILNAYKETGSQQFILQQLTKMKDILLKGYCFISLISELIKSLIESIDEKAFNEYLQILKIMINHNSCKHFSNSDFYLLKEYSLNNALNIFSWIIPCKKISTETVRSYRESINTKVIRALERQRKIQDGLKEKTSGLFLIDLIQEKQNENTLELSKKYFIPPPPNANLSDALKGVVQNIEISLPINSINPNKPQIEIMNDEDFYNLLETNDEIFAKSLDSLEQKGVLGQVWEEIPIEKKKELTPFECAFIRHYKDLGIEIKENFKGSEEMRHVWDQLKEIDYSQMAIVREIIQKFIYFFDKGNKEEMKNCVEYLEEENERVPSEDKEKKEHLTNIIMVIKEYIEEEQKICEEKKENIVREMIEVRGIGRVPIPEEWDEEVILSLPNDILQDNLVEYYRAHPLRNQKNTSVLNLNAIQNNRDIFKQSETNIQTMEKKYKAEKYKEKVNYETNLGLEETDYLFAFDSAINLLINSDKWIGKGIKQRIIYLCLHDETISYIIINNLMIHIFNKPFKQCVKSCNEKNIIKVMELLMILIKLQDTKKNGNASPAFIQCIKEAFTLFFKERISFGVNVKAMFLFRECVQRCISHRLEIQDQEAIYRYISNEGRVNEKEIDVFSFSIIEVKNIQVIIANKINKFIQEELVNEEELWYFIERVIGQKVDNLILFVDYIRLREKLKKEINEIRIKIVFGIFSLIGLDDRILSSEITNILEDTNSKVKKMLRNSPELIEKEFSILNKIPQYLPFEMKLGNLKKSNLSSKVEGNILVKVKRNDILFTLMESLRKIKQQEWFKTFRIQFVGEQGDDNGGLLKECYSSFIKEINEGKAQLFISEDNCTLIPNPEHKESKIKEMYEFIGKVIGKIILDGVTVDVHFNEAFLRLVLGLTNQLEHLDSIDNSFAQQMKKILNENVNDWGLCFVTDEVVNGEVKEIELKDDGKTTEVNETNKGTYVDLLVQHKYVKRISLQSEWFSQGLYSIISPKIIKQFTPSEIEIILCGNEIDFEDLKKNVVYEGYNESSIQIQWLWEILAEYGKEDHVKLLKFVTGQVRAPVGGFANLKTSNGTALPFTISSIKYDNPDDKLPTAHTCTNKLELPLYSTKEKLEKKLSIAINECTGYEFI
ncbi:ubiquitin protein ligase, putative [Entamoeba dispar SAW760]|uniref:HECT-type E3 ubiquitin transferase n=1 Tax=Entamoeba dispar (strain ATCC PRA-260 / SAW760) TaxID=370354 RepID=B0ECS8_ENTDS|nr:ubiquitin protein ligase, putative [Entamoeba dispar SAW760]EDR27620.1 ubiquitin protein ligase, putative [Entamoeba dispar SAW760]|eukprot:EDR27620.1 ubiquitin protein ligase, putative [Entamoeba dispar SAW760]